jgi:hypothetical protein
LEKILNEPKEGGQRSGGSTGNNNASSKPAVQSGINKFLEDVNKSD